MRKAKLIPATAVVAAGLLLVWTAAGGYDRPAEPWDESPAGSSVPRPAVFSGKAVGSEIQDILVTAEGEFLAVLEAKGAPERLKDHRFLILGIGPAEARAIADALAKTKPPRPQTHDLLQAVTEQLGGAVERVTVTRLEKNVFYAELLLRQGDRLIPVDARPSDSIALALRAGARVAVAEGVLEAAGVAESPLKKDQGGKDFY